MSLQALLAGHVLPGRKKVCLSWLQGLVWSTWAIIAALLALVVVSYNLFPDFEDPR